MSTQSLPVKILVGVSCDIETRGVGIARADRHAFLQATWLAQRTGGTVRAFHVTDFLDESAAQGRERVAAILRDSLQNQLDAMCNQASVSRVAATYGFAIGKPWFELLREAQRWEADLIMISPRRGDIGVADRLVHGSTARRLIRKASTPVWVAHPGPSVEINSVLACVDGSPVSERVVRTAHELAELGGAQRQVLRCLDYPDDLAVRRLPHAEEALTAYHTEVREAAGAHLKALISRVGGGGWSTSLEDGDVVDVVPDRVASREVDLVVLASTSRSWIAGVVLGTTAERILARTAVSTLVVRPADWRSPVAFEAGDEA